MQCLHIVPRQVAMRLGMTRYFTGNPCCNGHTCERDTSSKNCVECRRSRQRSRSATPEFKQRRAEYDRERLESDRDYLVVKSRRYYSENADAINTQKREYYAEHKDALAIAHREWIELNRAKIRHLNSKRKKIIKQATPPWADMAEIERVYKEADCLSKATGIPHHVDHYFPLQGKAVCGLHVHFNLRPLPALENIAKKNKCDFYS